MKKIFLLFFCTLLISRALVAQPGPLTPQWTWAKNLGTNSYDWMETSATDKDGNIFVAGSVYAGESLYLDDQVVPTDTALLINREYVVKLDASGKKLWSKGIYLKNTYMSGLNISKLVTDTDGDLFVLFHVGGESQVATTDTVYINAEKTMLLEGSGMGKTGVVKFNRYGDIVYTATILPYTESYGYASISQAIADDAGNLFITGSMNVERLSIGGKILYGGSTSNDLFLAKFSAAGIVQWANKDTSFAVAEYQSVDPTNMVLDNTGNPVVYGTWYGVERTYGSKTINNQGSTDMFVAKVNTSNGNVVYYKNLGGSVDETGSGLVADGLGNIYVSGFFNSPTLESLSLSSAQNDLFFFKLNSLGAITWSRSLATALSYAYSNYNKLTMGPDNQPVISGLFESTELSVGSDLLVNNGGTDVFVARYSDLGAVDWAKGYGSTSSDYTWDVFIDKVNNVTVAPAVAESLYFDGETVYATNQPGFLLAKYNPAGSRLFLANALPGVYETLSYSSIYQTSSGQFYVLGSINSGSLTLGSNYLYGRMESYDVLIAALGYSITGYVYDQEGVPVTWGSVKLFQLSGGNAAAAMIDSAAIMDDGSYVINKAPESNFILCAQPDIEYYPNLLATYSGNVSLWSAATVLDLNTAVAEDFNITLNQAQSVSGPGGINGYLAYTDAYNGGKGTTGTLGRPIKSASVVLVGKSTKGGNDSIIAITQTDELGYYEFGNIPLGAYSVRVDIPGLPMLELQLVTLTAGNTTANNVNYRVLNYGIVIDEGQSVINRPHNDAELFRAYPNPSVNGFFWIEIPQESKTIAHLEIYSMTGQLVRTLNIPPSAEGSVYKVNSADLSEGIYLLKYLQSSALPVYGRIMIAK
jgi:hypothetical protein